MFQFLQFLVFFIPLGEAIIGYDCGSRQLNVTTLSLRDVGDCEEPRDTINVTNQYIQLLQVNDYQDIPVIQCKLIIFRTVYYCGVYSHVSIVSGGTGEYMYEISAESCDQLHRTGSIQIDQNQVIHGLKVNTSTSHGIKLAGSVDFGGNCKGATYKDPYGSWDKVVVQGMITISLTAYTAQVKVDDNKIILRSGARCPLTDGRCIDPENGQTFWRSIPIDSCKFQQYSILYEGMATKMLDNDFDNSQIIYSLATNDITFALTVKGKELVCGYTVIKTEHPILFIFETTIGNTFANNRRISVNNLDIFTYVNSKFVYVEKHIRTQIKSLYWDVVTQRCNLERQTIKNSLSLATQAPDEFAYDLMKGPGYMAVVAGEVVHIIKCVPVEVRVEHGEHCFAELQVSKNNETMYLTPRTHILKSQGTRMPCNKLLPSYYLVGGSWYKILPAPTEAIPPAMIKPMKKPTWNYVNPAELAVSGIYSRADLDQLKERIMYPMERPAILNDLARELRGHPTEIHGGSFLKLLNEDAVEKIMENTWGKLWQKFMSFGTASAGVIALLMIIHAVKMIIDIGIRGYALHSIYGWSMHLLGAIWSSVANLLVHLGNPDKKRDPNSNQDGEEMKMINTPLNKQPEVTAPTLPDTVIQSNQANKQGYYFQLSQQ